MITIPDTAAGVDAARRPAYLAEPVPVSDRAGPWPGVVLMHDAFGLGDDMREQADWLAGAGFVTLVPDLYNGRSMVRCIKSTAAQLMAQQGPVFGQIEAARTYLAQLPNCTGTVGVIGYCLGGAFALLLAAGPATRPPRSTTVSFRRISMRCWQGRARWSPVTARGTPA